VFVHGGQTNLAKLQWCWGVVFCGRGWIWWSCNVTFRGKRIFGDCSDAAMLLLFVAGTTFREAAMWPFAASADLVKLQGGWSATFRGRDNVGEVAMSLFVASGIIGEVAVIEPLECGQVAASFSWHRAIAEHEMLHSSTLTFIFFKSLCWVSCSRAHVFDSLRKGVERC